MTAPALLDEVRAAEFPAGIDAEAALSALRTRTWETSAAYRVGITADSPISFGLTYFGKLLRNQETGVISFSWLHLDMCACALGWQDPGPQRDAWIAPRRSGKSVWQTLILPLWALAHGHRQFWLMFSYVDRQAQLHLRNALDELQSNALLLADFPGLAPRGKGGEVVSLAGGGTIAARGMAGTNLGIRAGAIRPDLMTSDDIEPGENENSEEKVAANRSRLINSILPMNNRAKVAVVGTVTMYDSLTHDFVHHAKRRPGKGDWVGKQRFRVHHYPALDGRGRSQWPQTWSAAELEAIREADEHEYALNYDCDPTPPKDQTYWTEGQFQYDSRFPIAARFMHIDVAVTTRDTSDFTVMALIAVDASGRRALVERVEWGRMTVPEMHELIWDICEPLDIKPRIRVESNQAGDTWKDSLAPWPPGVEYECKSTGHNKVTRIRQGHRHFVRRAVWLPWPLLELQQQLIAWHPRAKKDDIPDAVAGGLERAFGEAGSR